MANTFTMRIKLDTVFAETHARRIARKRYEHNWPISCISMAQNPILFTVIVLQLVVQLKLDNWMWMCLTQCNRVNPSLKSPTCLSVRRRCACSNRTCKIIPTSQCCSLPLTFMMHKAHTPQIMLERQWSLLRATTNVPIHALQCTFCVSKYWF